MMNDVIPADYQAWRHCIEVECQLRLTPDYIQKRIGALESLADFHTQQFVRRWGDVHRQQVLGWFRQAAQSAE